MEISASERERNLAARFWPQRKDNEMTLPCVEVAGVQVYVYFADGALRISAHYDTADEAVQNDQGVVPTRVIIGGDDITVTE